MADQTCNPQHVTQALGIQATGPRTVIVPADPIIWDARTSYEYLTLVASTDFGQGYVSKQDVPSGTPLTDTDYWIPVASYNAQLAVIQGDVAEINSNLDTLSTKVSDHTTDVINALEYYTDDIGKTINTLVSQGHSNIYIPAGTYTASTTVNLVDKTGVTIWSDYSVNTYTGSNGGCVINQTHQGAMFNLIGATSCAIKGIKIVGKNLTYACGFVLGTTPTTQYSQYNSLENCAVVYNEADVDTYGFYDCQGEILSSLCSRTSVPLGPESTPSTRNRPYHTNSPVSARAAATAASPSKCFPIPIFAHILFVQNDWF